MPRQGQWVPAYSDLARHEKTLAVARALGFKKHGPQAVAGYLITLWNRAASERIPADLGGPLTEAAVEHWAEWEGRRGAFLAALIASGYIDRRDGQLYLHDWRDGGGRSVKSSADAAERARRYRERVQESTRDATRDDTRDVSRDVTPLEQNRREEKRSGDPDALLARSSEPDAEPARPVIDWKAIDKEVRESGHAERYAFKRDAL